MELVQKIVSLLNDVSQWFDQNILHSAGGILKAVFDLMIMILQFLIDILKWVVQRL